MIFLNGYAFDLKTARVKPSKPPDAKRASVDGGAPDDKQRSETRRARRTKVKGASAPLADRSGSIDLGDSGDPSGIEPRLARMFPQSAIEIVPIGNLKPNPRNARKHSETQCQLLASSILKFGFRGLIGVDENYQIVYGHGRWEGAKRAHLTHVRCERITNLTTEQKSALALANNHLAELSEWDLPVLTATLQELSTADLDFDLEITGFDTVDLDRLLGPESISRQGKVDEDGYSKDADDRVPALQDDKPSISQSGDLWELGRQKLLHGDALDPLSYARLLDDEVAAQVLFDSPYNVPNRGHVSGKTFREFAVAHGELSRDEFVRFLARALTLSARSARDGAIFHVFMDHGHMQELLAAADQAGLEVKTLCVWVKPSPGMGTFYRSQHELVFVLKSGTAKHVNNFGLGARGRNRSNVWPYPAVRGVRRGVASDDGGHPTPKPVSLIIDALRDCSMRGDIVLDPFGGSGTTLIAAERIGRRAPLIEIDGHYCDLIIRRWQALTGARAVRVSDGRHFDDVAAASKVGNPSNSCDGGHR